MSVQKLTYIFSLALLLSSCAAMFEVSDYNRADDLFPQQRTSSVTAEYHEEEAISEESQDPDDYDYFDPDYNIAEPFNSPFASAQSFNACNPYSSSLWMSPSIAYWNRQMSWGMGMGYGMSPYYSNWNNPAWNPYGSGLYNPWYYQPTFGYMSPSVYNPYYNQWMTPGWGGDFNRSPVYYQKRDNANRRTQNQQFVPGRNITPLGNVKKRSSQSVQQAQPRGSNAINSGSTNRVRIVTPPVSSPNNTVKGNRSRQSPNKVDWAKPTRVESPNRSRPPAFSSPTPSYSSPSRSSSPSRPSSPNRRR